MKHPKFLSSILGFLIRTHIVSPEVGRRSCQKKKKKWKDGEEKCLYKTWLITLAKASRVSWCGTFSSTAASFANTSPSDREPQPWLNKWVTFTSWFLVVPFDLPLSKFFIIISFCFCFFFFQTEKAFLKQPKVFLWYIWCNKYASFTSLFWFFFSFSNMGLFIDLFFVLFFFSSWCIFEALRNLGRERGQEKVGTAFGNPSGLDLRLPVMPLKVYSVWFYILGILFVHWDVFQVNIFRVIVITYHLAWVLSPYSKG